MPTSTKSARTSGTRGRGWLRALALFAVTLFMAVLDPLALVAVPFVVLVLVLPTPRASAVFAGLLAALVAFGLGTTRSGLWYLERGWAVLLGGWFVALTLRWPRATFFPRALGAVAGSFGVGALFFAVQPGRWAVADWIVQDRMAAAWGLVMQAVRAIQNEGGTIPPEVLEGVTEMIRLQGTIFPSLLGLTSLAALGVAWWLYVRLARGSDRGVAPLAEFRFNDQLVWVLIAGLVFLLAGWGDAWARTGGNAVVFMGGLYALRGAAVLVFLNGGISVFAAVALGVGMLIPVVASVILGGALVIGIGDTWFDLRTRAVAAADQNES